jgi:hypothetical protein
LRANAVTFHDGLGTQRPHAFEIPGARGPIDAGASFLRHLRRAGADAACRAAHQDRLPGSIRAYSNSICHAVTATTGRPAAVT